MSPRKLNCFVRRVVSMLALPALLCIYLTFAAPLYAQNEPPEHRWTANVGGGFTPTLGDISSRLDTGGHVTVGGGYNFSDNVALTLEYMWTGMAVDRSVLRALAVPNGDAHIHALTLNPVFRFAPKHHVGGYFIMGIGYYRRTVEFTRPSVAVVTVFDPWWGYFGPAVVPADQVLGSVTRDGGGMNAGIGLTLGLGHTGAKFYTEVRYHYVATHGARNTQILPVTFGVRW